MKYVGFFKNLTLSTIHSAQPAEIRPVFGNDWNVDDNDDCALNLLKEFLVGSSKAAEKGDYSAIL